MREMRTVAAARSSTVVIGSRGALRRGTSLIEPAAGARRRTVTGADSTRAECGRENVVRGPSHDADGWHTPT